MPKLNKCIHRKIHYGYIYSNGKITKFSTKIWFSCELLCDQYPQGKCKGWNCGRYKDKGDKT